MYLSDNELEAAIADGSLIFDPKPDKIDPTSIDVHLGGIDSVSIWNIAKLAAECADLGRPETDVYLGSFNSQRFSSRYLCPPPEYRRDSESLVMRHGDEMVVRPNGFLL